MAFGKNKPKLGMYSEQQDTPWITSNRELNSTSYGNLSRDLNNVNVFDDAIRQQLNAYNDSIYNQAVKDFDRDYSQTMNKYLARDYNRFGTTGGTSSLLTRDNYNLAQQRKLADMEYNRAMNYEDMINQELSRRYQWLNLNNQLFNQSGATTQAFDDANWRIRNQNVDRRYTNELQDYNSKAGLWKAGANLAGMALAPFTGGTSLLLGNALGGMLGAESGNLLAGQTGSNMDNAINQAMKNFGYIGGQKGWDMFKDYAKSGNTYNSMFGSNSGMFGNLGRNALSWLGSKVGDLNYDNIIKQMLYEALFGVGDTRGNVVDANTGIMNV